jgi:hypothetical protein
MTSEFNRTALFSRVQPGGVFTIDDLKEAPGNIFFVDSGETVHGGDSAGFGRSPDSPFLTLDYAIGNCTANNGDVIYLMPGHAETIIADSGVDIDVAGVKVIGLGWGGSRPTFTFTTAVAADFKLAAACCWIENILFLGGIDALTGPIEVSAADNTIVNCEYRDVTGQATDTLVTVDGADRLTIRGWKHNGANAAGPNSAIALDGSDDFTLSDFHIYGDFAVGAIDFRAHASARAKISNGFIWTENAADIAVVDTITGSTGVMGPDLELVLQDNAANITEAITGATFYVVDPVYVVNAVAEKAMLINWTASTD